MRGIWAPDRAGGHRKSPGLSTGVPPPPMDTPPSAAPTRGAGRASPTYSSTSVRECQGPSPVHHAPPARRVAQSDAAGTRDGSRTDQPPRHAGEARKGRGEAPRPEASRLPQAPSGGRRDGREAGEKPPTTTGAARLGAAKRNPSSAERAAAGPKPRPPEAAPERAAGPGEGKPRGGSTTQTAGAQRTGAAQAAQRAAPGPTERNRRGFPQPGPAHRQQSRARRGTGQGPHGAAAQASTREAQRRATKGSRAPGGRRASETLRAGHLNPRGPHGAAPQSGGRARAPPGGRGKRGGPPHRRGAPARTAGAEAPDPREEGGEAAQAAREGARAPAPDLRRRPLLYLILGHYSITP